MVELSWCLPLKITSKHTGPSPGEGSCKEEVRAGWTGEVWTVTQVSKHREAGRCCHPVLLGESSASKVLL